MSKMANRIMPVTASKEVEESSSLSLLDLDKIAQALGLTKQAEVEEDKEDKEEVDATCEAGDEECEDEEPSKKPFPGAAAPFKKKESEVEDGRLKMPSAQVLEEKIRNNDKEGYKQALAQRSAVRAQLMKIAENLPEDTDLAEERRQIIASVAAKEDKKVISSPSAKEAPVKKVASKKVQPEKAETFKKAANMDEMSKLVIAKRLKAVGMDDNIVSNYIKLAFASPKKVEVPEFVTKLASMKAEKEDKTALLKTWMQREAKLNADDKSRVLDYWKNELGYQDEQWCADMVEDVDPVKGA